MKLCPQCEFIYEDEQSFCDMDGTGLVHNAAADPPISRLTIPLVFDKDPTPRHSSSISAAALVVIVLAGLVVAAYFTRTRQSLAQNYQEPAQSSLPAEQPAQAASQSSVSSPTDQSSAANDVAKTSSAQPSDETTASTAPNQPEENATSVEASAAKMSSANARLKAGPVAAAPFTMNNSPSVVLRLTNGVVIKADDAWEKNDGVWYRQAGVVTFVKRSHVRSIERVPVSTRSQATTRTAVTTTSRNQPAKSSDTRDRLHIAKLEPAKPKKESRVTSFLKKTGNLIKRPFRL